MAWAERGLRVLRVSSVQASRPWALGSARERRGPPGSLHPCVPASAPLFPRPLHMAWAETGGERALGPTVSFLGGAGGGEARSVPCALAAAVWPQLTEKQVFKGVLILVSVVGRGGTSSEDCFC